jgi:ketosteroid isomerase-like protein
MSQENVEIVRSHAEAYLAGDYEGTLAAYHPEAEFDARIRPEGAVYHGHEGIVEAMRVWVGAWDDWKLEFEELLDAGDKVLAIARESGRGKGSGVEIDHQVFVVFTLRDGLITRWLGFSTERPPTKPPGYRKGPLGRVAPCLR